MILSDSTNKKIYKSTDGGSEFSRVDVPFRASFFHFTKDPNVIIGVEENEQLKNVTKKNQIYIKIIHIINLSLNLDMD